MIKEYDNYDIIKSCYGDTNNIDKLCLDAATHVKDMHNKYQEYIGTAERISKIIVANTLVGIFAFIPTNSSDACTKSGVNLAECTGFYSPYQMKVNWDFGTSCIFDTTKNNSFKTAVPDLNGKLYVCWETSTGRKNSYLRKCLIRK